MISSSPFLSFLLKSNCSVENARGSPYGNQDGDEKEGQLGSIGIPDRPKPLGPVKNTEGRERWKSVPANAN